MRLTIMSTLAMGVLAVAGVAQAQDWSPGITGVTTKGPALVDDAGMSLYVFDKDAIGRSACNGACAQNWPPLTAAADAHGAGRYQLIRRDDGARQWAVDGHPLYRWSRDVKPGDATGDATGDGFLNGAWSLARPAAKP